MQPRGCSVPETEPLASYKFGETKANVSEFMRFHGAISIYGMYCLTIRAPYRTTPERKACLGGWAFRKFHLEKRNGENANRE